MAYNNVLHAGSTSEVLLDFNNMNWEKPNVPYNEDMAYARSKLCIVLSTVHWAELLKKHQSPIKIGCLHPGIVFSTVLASSFGKQKKIYGIVHLAVQPLMLVISKTPQQGAQISLYVVNEDKKQVYKRRLLFGLRASTSQDKIQYA